MSILPPLNALKAFEAAARHQSFKHAADEMHVSDGAISRHVANLEAWLGVRLFFRTRRRVSLTPEGNALFVRIAPVFENIAVAVGEFSSRRLPVTLHVNSPPILTERWLIPRLPAFLKEHPDLNVRVTTSIEPVEFVGGGYDVAIRALVTPPDGLAAAPVAAMAVTPLCHPALLDGSRPSAPADLGDHTLIHATTRPGLWPHWFNTFAGRQPRAARTLTFQAQSSCINAAVNGSGIAIGPSGILVDDIASGRLALPFPDLIAGSATYFVLSPSTRSANEAAIKAFQSWVADEGARSSAGSARPPR